MLAAAKALVAMGRQVKTVSEPERVDLRPTCGADAFISHASEDKAAAARPIAQALAARGYTVWLDESELKIGDRLLDKIDDGLAIASSALSS